MFSILFFPNFLYIKNNFTKIYSKTFSKGSNYSHGNSSRSSIQMLPIISGLVEKQVPEFGKLNIDFYKYGNQCIKRFQNILGWLLNTVLVIFNNSL